MGSRKKRSRKRSPTPEPPELVFFVDRDLSSKTFLRLLREAGLRIEGHNDHFGPTTPDVDWIGTVGARGWLALTANKDIRYDSAETRAVMEAGLKLFVLTSRQTNHEVLALNLVRTWAKVARFASKHPPPFIAKVSRPNREDERLGRPGTVRMYCSYDDWHHGRRS